MLVVTMLKFNRHHGLEPFYGFPDGVIKYPIDDVNRFAGQRYAFALCSILHTLAQNIVFGNNFGDVKTCLPAKQAVFCRNYIRLTLFIWHTESVGEIVQKLRYFVVDSWSVEAGGARKLSHLMTPASE